jgi:hypothetical protein
MDRIIKIYEEKEDWGDSEDNKVFKGLEILNKYAEKEVQVNPAHDEIFAGLEDEEYEKMTEEDIRRIFEIGWFIDEESFAVFT